MHSFYAPAIEVLQSLMVLKISKILCLLNKKIITLRNVSMACSLQKCILNFTFSILIEKSPISHGKDNDVSSSKSHLSEVNNGASASGDVSLSIEETK